MNANELANELERPNNWQQENNFTTQAATMLRQQQEQIDKLTAIVALRELNIERMIEKQSHYEALAHAGGVEAGKELKELTDEELFKVYADLEEVYTGNNFPVDLGRAILRKAQEK